MSLVRWFDGADPFAHFAQFNDVAQQLDRALTGWRGFGGDFWPSARAGVYPALDVYDDGESFIVQAEAPGLDRKSLEVTVHGTTLTLKGQRLLPAADDKTAWHRRERQSGEFHRSLTLPEAVDGEKVLATYNDGILEVRLPRAESAKARKIKIA